MKNMHSSKKSAAIIVIFNPNNEVIGNLHSYNKEVDRVYLIDNSTEKNPEFDTEEFTYIPLRKNIGFCSALNMGCNLAIKDGADILVTLNQDSVCVKGTIKELLNCVTMNPHNIYGPNLKYIYRDKLGNRVFSEEWAFPQNTSNVPWLITSGNAFSKDAFLSVGGYDDSLFVDLIDIDFCYKVKKNGYGVIRLGDVFIYQESGHTKKVSLCFKNLHIPNHSPDRYFYIFRNEKFLRKKYGKDYDDYRVALYKYLISIIFFERNKLQKIIACIRGYKTARKGSWENKPYA